MLAMQLEAANQQLKLIELPIPEPCDNEILLKVKACGICRTDLHIMDQELPNPHYPIILGHQIVGEITALGQGVSKFSIGERLGVPWLGRTCRICSYCLEHRENLCDDARYTGYNISGGFAEYCIANADYCFPIPAIYSDVAAAPLLCAGLIGYRSFKKLPDSAKDIGIFGFGAAAHIITQIMVYLGKEVYAFTKRGDIAAQQLALHLGAKWAGDSNSQAPVPLDGAIIFAPVGDLIPIALAATKKGSTIVCGGIHMSTIPSFPYKLMWGERSLVSITNLTVRDGKEFFSLVNNLQIKTQVTIYRLEHANRALDDLRHGRYTGAGVIVNANSG